MQFIDQFPTQDNNKLLPNFLYGKEGSQEGEQEVYMKAQFKRLENMF